MTDGKNFFDQPVKSYIKTYENIWRIETGQEDNYTTGCLLNCSYFNKLYKMMVIDSRKQQALDADPKAVQQTNFTGNINRPEDATKFFIIGEVKETILHFSEGIVELMWFYFVLMQYQYKLTQYIFFSYFI